MVNCKKKKKIELNNEKKNCILEKDFILNDHKLKELNYTLKKYSMNEIW